MGTSKITGLGDPTSAQDAATKNYVDNSVQGLDAKASAVAATTANITLSGTQTIDGVSVIAGDRVLVKDQTAPAENGIYVAAASTWDRSSDANTWDELVSAFVFVEGGTANADSGWTCTSAAGGTLGVTAVTWVQFSGAGQITAGTGLSKTGNTINVNTASSSRIVVGADEIDLATTGVTAGTYKSITVDAFGRATAGTNPTTISGFGITDAYTKTEIDTSLSGKLNNTGGTMSGAIAMATNKVTGLGDPTNAQDATTKTYVDGILGSATSAATSAAAALVSENNAATSASSATASATAAAASYDSFDDRYLGAKSSDPTLDNDGNALLTGALYWNTVSNVMKAYTGSAWVVTYVPSSGFLTTADIGVSVQAYDADLTSWAAITPATKQDTLTSGTNIKTINSTSLLGSGDVAVQATLVSGTNIKTINSTSILGSGDITTGDVTLTGTQTLTNKTITGFKETSTASSSNNFNLANANYFTHTLSGATTFTVSNTASSGSVSTLILNLTNGGSAAITWWSGMKWAAGTAPTLTASGRDVLGFFTYDGGTTWSGLVLGKDIK
jgi:hypothetical protein